MKRIEPPPMSLTAKQLEAVRAMQKANTEFWATPEANITQKEIAKLQSKIAIQAGHNHRRTRKATVAKIKKGKDSLASATAAMPEYRARGVSLERAADFIAPTIVSKKGKPLSSRQTKRHLRKAGYKTRK